MKLKTEMKNCADGMVCVSKGIDMQLDREHDAAMAHALVIALGELGVTRDGIFAECCQASDTRQFVFERAAEIMAQWGYPTD